MRTIRASEINSYMYCKRAWWYQKRGEKSQNIAALDAGTGFHHRHGRQVAWAIILKILGWITLLAAVITAVIALVFHFLP